MQKLITLSYYIKGEEVRPKFLKAYHNMEPNIIKLDCLQDAIYYLQKEYDKVFAERLQRIQLIREKNNATTIK